jgi:hypothetical protein
VGLFCIYHIVYVIGFINGNRFIKTDLVESPEISALTIEMEHSTGFPTATNEWSICNGVCFIVIALRFPYLEYVYRFSDGNRYEKEFKFVFQH